MNVIIDRFEGDYAVCEYPDGEMKNILRDHIPSEALEGDALLIAPDGKITIDREATEKRRAEIEAMAAELWK